MKFEGMETEGIIWRSPVIEEIKIQGEKMQYVRISLQEKILLAKVLIIFHKIFA
jgi:hypothetical protein